MKEIKAQVIISECLKKIKHVKVLCLIEMENYANVPAK